MINGYIKQVETMGVHDGPGIRTIFFMQGCPLRCLYCHNPEMFEFIKENPYTPLDVLNIALKYKNYYGNDGGVTFSGGEPLGQSEFLIECLKLMRQKNIHTAIDTAGSVFNNFTKEILELVDLVIYDVKAVNRNEYEAITNFKQNNTIEFINMCQQYNKKLWIRQVIVPGINNNVEHINKLGSYLKNIKNIDKIELIPYHKMGISKYTSLNIKYPLPETPAMSIIECNKLQEKLDKLLEKVSI